jgi:hypothetical protein
VTMHAAVRRLSFTLTIRWPPDGRWKPTGGARGPDLGPSPSEVANSRLERLPAAQAVVKLWLPPCRVPMKAHPGRATTRPLRALELRARHTTLVPLTRIGGGSAIIPVSLPFSQGRTSAGCPGGALGPLRSSGFSGIESSVSWWCHSFPGLESSRQVDVPGAPARRQHRDLI